MMLLTVFFKMFGLRWLFSKFRPLIGWVMFRILFGGALGFGFAMVSVVLSKHHAFWIPYLFLGLFGLYITVFFNGFFKLDEWLFKVFGLAIPLSLLIGVISKYFYSTNIEVSYFAILAATVVSGTLFFILSLKNGIMPLIKKMFDPKIPIDKTLQEIDAMGNGDTYEKGRQFEDYVAALYNALGYHAETTTEMRHKGTLPGAIQSRGGSGEQGVDVVLYDPRNGETYIVQCKHYSSKVSNSAIQEIVTAKALYNATRAFVVTNQEFTGPAIELAEVNNVELVDRNLLPTLILNAVECERNKKAA